MRLRGSYFDSVFTFEMAPCRLAHRAAAALLAAAACHVMARFPGVTTIAVDTAHTQRLRGARRCVIRRHPQLSSPHQALARLLDLWAAGPGRAAQALLPLQGGLLLQVCASAAGVALTLCAGGGVVAFTCMHAHHMMCCFKGQ